MYTTNLLIVEYNMLCPNNKTNIHITHNPINTYKKKKENK